MLVFAGCDRKKYQDRRNEMGETHRLKVETLIKKWQDAEKRYNVLKSSDGDQAASSMAGEYKFFFWLGGEGRGYMNSEF